MKKAKSRAQRRRAVRNVLLAVSMMMMLMIVTVGGTVAWLTAETDQVVNTFTATDIKITLTETPNQEDKTWKAQIIPGKEYDKDPIVTVVRPDTNVDVWLFVEFNAGTSATYLEYTSNLTDANEWYQVPGTTNVWYREVPASETNPTYHLLDDDKVKVRTNIVKDEPDEGQVKMPAANETITMTYQAYAVQKDELAVTDAWKQIDSSYSYTPPAVEP